MNSQTTYQDSNSTLRKIEQSWAKWLKEQDCITNQYQQMIDMSPYQKVIYVVDSVQHKKKVAVYRRAVFNITISKI